MLSTSMGDEADSRCTDRAADITREASVRWLISSLVLDTLVL